MPIQRIAPAEICGYSAGGVSFRGPVRGIYHRRLSSALPLSGRRRGHGRGCTPAPTVLAVFVAGVVEKGLYALAGLVLFAVPAGDVTSCQAAFLHPAPCPAQIPRAVQVFHLAALAGFQILAASSAVSAAAAALLRAAHWDVLPSE